MSRRVSARLSVAVVRASRMRSIAGCSGSARSTAYSSIPMLDRPWATVSWISPASRVRSDSRPTSRCRAASSERVRTRSAITRRRAADSLCSARTPTLTPIATRAPTTGPVTPAAVHPRPTPRTVTARAVMAATATIPRRVPSTAIARKKSGNAR